MNQPEKLLQQYFGHASFRTGQKQAIDAILSGRDVLAVMPTGAGKSVCYQISALLLRGVTIVISPLISLMKDQVEALRQVGIPAAYVNSSITQEEFYHTVQMVQQGQCRILYVAPERLMTESFFRLTQQVPVSMIAVDEAHCVSQWGQDFRQSYLDIPVFMEQLPARPICTAFTATATKQVEADIARILKLQEPEIIHTGFDRKNLFFGVRRPNNKTRELFQLLRENDGKSGIVYCSTRKAVEEVCDALRENGFPATRYHAGLSDTERAQNQDDFLYDRQPIMVATNAFGMGIDKSNVSFVIHYNMPMDLESYYQEAGRARTGRLAGTVHSAVQRKRCPYQRFPAATQSGNHRGGGRGNTAVPAGAGKGTAETDDVLCHLYHLSAAPHAAIFRRPFTGQLRELFLLSDQLSGRRCHHGGEKDHLLRVSCPERRLSPEPHHDCRCADGQQKGIASPHAAGSAFHLRHYRKAVAAGSDAADR